MRYPVLLSLWLLTDLLIFVGMYTLAYFWRVGWIVSTDYPLSQHLEATVVGALFCVSALVTTRTFALARNQLTAKNGAYIAYSTMIGVCMFALTYYFLYQELFSRLLIIQAWFLSMAGLWLWHILYATVMRSSLRQGKAVFRALIVGVTRESQELVKQLNEHKNPIKPVAILDARGSKETEVDGVPVKGKLNKLEDVLVDDEITHLIQCSDLEQSLNLLSACRQHGITYMLLPSVLGIVERDERVESLEGHPVTMVSPNEKKWMWFFR